MKRTLVVGLALAPAVLVLSCTGDDTNGGPGTPDGGADASFDATTDHADDGSAPPDAADATLDSPTDSAVRDTGADVAEGGNDAGTDAADAGTDAADSGSDAGDAGTALASIYVLQKSSGANGGTVYGYPADGGNSVPSQTFYSTQTINLAVDIAVDGAGFIYVLDQEPSAANNAVQVFPASGINATAPVRVIKGPSTHLADGVNSLFVTQSGEVYVASNGTIERFAAGANGDATPAQFIQVQDTATWTSGFGGIGVDPTGSWLYLTGVSSIGAFPFGASGTLVNPSRVIIGPATIPGKVDNPTRLFVGPTGTLFDLDEGSGNVLEFASNAADQDAPIGSFRSPSGAIPPGGGLRLDSTGRIYVLGFTEGMSVFAPGATGPTPTPLFTIMPSIYFTSPTGVATTL